MLRKEDSSRKTWRENRLCSKSNKRPETKPGFSNVGRSLREVHPAISYARMNKYTKMEGGT